MKHIKSEEPVKKNIGGVAAFTVTLLNAATVAHQVTLGGIAPLPPKVNQPV